MSKEFREAIGRKISGISNVWVETAKKGGKGLKVLGTGSKFKFFLDGLDQVFKVEPIVIEGLNHAMNLGLEFLKQYEVNFSCVKQEAKLITEKWSQERLTMLCSAEGSLFLFMHKGRKIDKTGKKYMQYSLHAGKQRKSWQCHSLLTKSRNQRLNKNQK